MDRKKPKIKQDITASTKKTGLWMVKWKTYPEYKQISFIYLFRRNTMFFIIRQSR